MDRRPLLTSGHDASAAVSPRNSSPLLPPSTRRTDASMILVGVDGSVARQGTPARRNAGDTRCSFLSSLSFSAWSDGEATAPGTTNRSGLGAALRRPFQRMRMWDSGASLWRRCFCCGPPAAWLLGADDEGDDDDEDSGGIVHIGTPSANSRSARQGEDAAHGAPSDSSQAGSLDGSRGHPHRQYAPPRSRSNGTSGRASVATPPSPLEWSQPAPSPHADDSPNDSLLADLSSTSPSSPSASRQLGGHAESEGGHLVMQRGVLVRMASDGTYTRVPEAPMYSGLGRPASGWVGDGRALQLDAAAESYGAGGHGYTGDSPTSVIPGEDVDSSSPAAVAMVLSGLEASRQPLRTLDQLSTALARCAPYLPIRVEAEADLNSSNSAVSAVLAASTPMWTTAGEAAPGEEASPADMPALPFCVHVLGPLHPCPTYPALRTLEDMLLEDCDGRQLCLNALHCADLDLRRVPAGEDGTDGASGGAGRRATSLTAAARPLALSNPFLDLLVSPATDPYATTAAGGGSSGAAGAATDSKNSTAAAVAQVLSFVKGVVATHAAQLTTLHFTRCYVVPHDMGRAIPLPLATVRRLRFEHCALTPAHVDALLAVARHQDALTSSRLADTRAVAASAAHHHHAFAVLEELELSGALTPECVSELLDYIEEQQSLDGEAAGSGGRGPALRLVSVPIAVVRAVREHPFVQASAGRIQVASL